VGKTSEAMGTTKQKASEASDIAGQKTNQACSLCTIAIVCGTHSLTACQQAAAGAKEAKDDFKKEVKK